MSLSLYDSPSPNACNDLLFTFQLSYSLIFLSIPSITAAEAMDDDFNIQDV